MMVLKLIAHLLMDVHPSKFVSLLNCAIRLPSVDIVMQVVPIQPHNGGYVSSLYHLCLTASDNIAISMLFELTHSLFGCCARGDSVLYNILCMMSSIPIILM